jgi:aspartyl-tRNA(Asn)/glutamyl-tRNA(Gln) amidotransferase subunit A
MHNLTAIEIRDKFLKGEISAVAITENFLNRITKYDKEIGSFLAVYNERALKKAKELDEKLKNGEKLGKLAAIPIAIKDNIHVKGEITTCASKFLTNYKAPFNSTAVQLLEAEDAIIIGKTNLDEFAMGSSTENSALQMTRNPWNLNCVPGGSSGGSAAAVAARFCPIALGSDTGGSVRQPAAFCGVVGFKPTYGRISRNGLVAYGSSLDQIGPIAANTEDIALVMEVLGQHCDKDSTSLPIPPDTYANRHNGIAGIKIGVPRQFLNNLAEEPKKVFNDALETLKNLGAVIVDIDLNILKYSIATYYIVATAEASTNLARFDGIRYGHRSSKATTLNEVYDFSKEEGYGKEVKKRILLGTYVLSAGYQNAFYKKAQKVRTLIIDCYKKAFAACDIIATPVSPFAAFEIGSIKDPIQMYLEDIYTIPVNLAGLPAISIPDGFSKDGKPMGLQLIGPQKGDMQVIQTALAFEKAKPEFTVAPNLLTV